MAGTTGRLGVVAAELGNVILGQDTSQPVHIASATDTLALNDAAGSRHTFACSTLSALAIGDQATVNHIALRSATSTLAIGDQATLKHVALRSATSALTVVDTAVGLSSAIQYVGATDALSLLDTAAAHDTVQRPGAIDLIALGHAAGSRHIAALCTVSALALGDEAAVKHVALRAVTSALTVADAAASVSSAIHYVGATDALSLLDTADERNSVQRLNAIDAIDISDSTAAWQQKHWSLQVTDAIPIADAANEIGPIYAGAVDVLQTSDQVWDSTNNVSQTVYTGLQDSNSEVIWHGAQSVADRLSFGELIQVGVIRSTAIALAATDALSLSDAAVKSPSPEVVDGLELGDMALVAVGRPTTDPLTIGDRASVVVVRLLSAEDNIVIEQSFIYTLPFGLAKRDYRPFIGAGAAGNPTPSPATLAGPNLAAPGTFTLVYPSTGTATDTLVLRDPEFGNKDRLQFNRISRETRGGTLIVYADPMWPKTETLVLTFSALTPTQAEALLEFMLNHIGLEIGLWDWEGHYWVGVITNPNDPVVEDSKYSFTAGLEFEGQLVS